MEDYSVLWGNMWKQLIEIWNLLVQDDGSAKWRGCIVIWAVMGSMHACYKMLRVGFRNRDVKMGTIPFWLVINAGTFGVGSIVGYLLYKCQYSRGVYAKPKYMLFQVFMPSLFSIVIRLASLEGWIHYNVDVSTALFLGVCLGFLQMIWTACTPWNREMHIWTSAGDSCQSYIERIATSYKERIALYRLKGNLPRCMQDGKTVNAFKVSEKSLQEYLLLSEEEGIFTKQTYQKPSGSILQVVEIPSLVYTSIWNSVAGILLAVMISTPYISTMLGKVIDYLM